MITRLFCEIDDFVNTIKEKNQLKSICCDSKTPTRMRAGRLSLSEKAERGHSTMGWFYGFKLHLIVLGVSLGVFRCL